MQYIGVSNAYFFLDTFIASIVKDFYGRPCMLFQRLCVSLLPGTLLLRLLTFYLILLQSKQHSAGFAGSTEGVPDNSGNLQMRSRVSAKT